MIQSIKDTLVAGFTAGSSSGQPCEGLDSVTDSELEILPTDLGKVLQIQFSHEEPPDALQGFGTSTHFGTWLCFRFRLKSTGPEPGASRAIHNLWFRRNEVTGQLAGVKLAVNLLLAGGLAVSPKDVFAVEQREPVKPMPPHGAWQTGLEWHLWFRSQWSE